jgi:hypothetical protein
LTEEQWFEFDPGSMTGVSFIRFTYTIDDANCVDGKNLAYGVLAAADGPPSHEYQYELLGYCSIEGGSFDIPVSYLTPNVTNYVCIAPGWQAMWNAECCDDAMLQGIRGPLGDPGTGYPGGCEFNSGSIEINTCTAKERVVSGAGMTPWTPPEGDIDGDNRVYTLTDWSGKGVPQVRIGGIIYAAETDYEYDDEAGTITMAFAPWVGAELEARWRQ